MQFENFIFHLQYFLQQTSFQQVLGLDVVFDKYYLLPFTFHKCCQQ